MRDDFAAVAADLVRRGVTRPGGHYPPIPVVEPTHSRETLSRLSVSTILDAPSRSYLRPRSCSRDAASLLLSLEEWIDTNSAAGELVFHVFGAIAHFRAASDRRANKGTGSPPLELVAHTPGATLSIQRRAPGVFPWRRRRARRGYVHRVVARHLFMADLHPLRDFTSCRYLGGRACCTIFARGATSAERSAGFERP
jgi:hypothetical protein